MLRYFSVTCIDGGQWTKPRIWLFIFLSSRRICSSINSLYSLVNPCHYIWNFRQDKTTALVPSLPPFLFSLLPSFLLSPPFFLTSFLLSILLPSFLLLFFPSSLPLLLPSPHLPFPPPSLHSFLPLTYFWPITPQSSLLWKEARLPLTASSTA